MVPKSILLPRNGWVPNNPVLPVKLYIEVEPRERTDLAETFEARFHKHGWEPEWRDQIYDYDHYHSTAHEVLGMASGHAILALGGSKAFEIKVRAGDALLLPAGTGHRAIEQSRDFLAVGAYPDRTGTFVASRPARRCWIGSTAWLYRNMIRSPEAHFSRQHRRPAA